MVFRLGQVTGRALGRYQNMTGSPSRLVMKRRGELWRWGLGAQQQPHSAAAILHIAIAGSDGHKDLAALTIYMVLYSYLPSSKENQKTIPQNPL